MKTEIGNPVKFYMEAGTVYNTMEKYLPDFLVFCLFVM